MVSTRRSFAVNAPNASDSTAVRLFRGQAGGSNQGGQRVSFGSGSNRLVLGGELGDRAPCSCSAVMVSCADSSAPTCWSTPKTTDRPVASALSPGCGWRARQTGAHLLPNASREVRHGRRCPAQCDACQVCGDAIRCASAATLTFNGRRRRPRMDRADRRRWLKQVDPVPPIPSSQRVARLRPRRWTHGR